MQKYQTIKILSVLGMLGIVVLPVYSAHTSLPEEPHSNGNDHASSSSGLRRVVSAVENPNPVGQRPKTADDVMDIGGRKAVEAWRKDDQAALQIKLDAASSEEERIKIRAEDKENKRRELADIKRKKQRLDEIYGAGDATKEIL